MRVPRTSPRAAILTALAISTLFPRAVSAQDRGPEAVFVNCGYDKVHGTTPLITVEYVDVVGRMVLLLSYETFRPVQPGASGPIGDEVGCPVLHASMDKGALTLTSDRPECRATLSPIEGSKLFRGKFGDNPEQTDCELARTDGRPAQSPAQVFEDIGALQPLVVRDASR
jgi:hypothetical protein